MKGLPLLLSCAAAFAAEPPLKLVQTIPLQVERRIDHMSLDAKRRRLFVSAMGNDTVEAVDLEKGKVFRTLSGFQEPQGVQYLPGADVLAVANAGDGKLHLFKGDSLKPLKTLPFGEDADNMREGEAGLLWVGYGPGAVGVVDPASGKRVGDIQYGGGHPEAFELEKNGSRLFINVPPAKEIVVADTQTRAVLARWKIDAVDNFALALDEKNGRLFSGFRVPARLQVFDTATGAKKADLPLCGDSDELIYDEQRRRVDAACGEGVIDVFAQDSPDKYRLLAKIATAPGARTAFLDSAASRLYLGVPHRGEQKSELRVYSVAP